MTDLEKTDLRGPVRKSVTELRGAHGLQIEEHSFDSVGRILELRVRNTDGSEFRKEFRFGPTGKRLDTNERTELLEDGSRVEIEELSGTTYWTTDGLHGVSFVTKDAAVARTSFDRRGAPLETVFEGSTREHLSSVTYTCDEHANIVEAVQRGGTADPLTAMVEALQSGAEQCRVSFRHDHASRVIEEAVYILGQRIQQTANVYNDRGDLLMSATDAGPPTHFEYEYDEHGNWIRKIARHPHGFGTDEYRRRISYDEG